MKFHKIAFILLIIGGLNWLLTALNAGIGNYVAPNVATVIYVIIGLAAIYEIVTHKKNCKHCM
jgi:uncharacterized membrane protein YuzA (DUF378 family)